MKRKVLTVVLALIMIATIMHTGAAVPSQRITPGQTVTGSLHHGNKFVEYTVSGMQASGRWGVRLTMTINGAADYEVMFSEEVLDRDGNWRMNRFFEGIYPGLQQSGLIWSSSNSFVYETPIDSYSVNEYRYWISIPEYYDFSDFPASARFNYTLELFQAGTPSSPPAASNISVIVGGRAITMDVAPQLINGRVMVPLRAIADAIGPSISVDWDASSQSVHLTVPDGNVYNEYTLRINDRNVIYTFTNSQGSVNSLITIDSPPVIVNGRTLVPLRFIAEAAFCEVNWDESTRTVYIQPPY